MSTDSVSSEAPKTFKVKSTEIIIESAFKLNGILCTPEGVENPPVVVMVQGSGQSDYDETVSANKPFKILPRALLKTVLPPYGTTSGIINMLQLPRRR